MTAYTTFDNETIQNAEDASRLAEAWKTRGFNAIGTDIYKWNLKDAIRGLTAYADANGDTIEIREAIGVLRIAYFTHTGKALVF